jgi:hypothetical protein
MSALDEIRSKTLSEMTPIELAIWFTNEGTTAYDMEQAAAELAVLTAERDALKAVIEEYSARLIGKFNGGYGNIRAICNGCQHIGATTDPKSIKHSDRCIAAALRGDA